MSNRRASDVRWEGYNNHRAGMEHHAFWAEDPVSVCGRRPRSTREKSHAVPNHLMVCPQCFRGIVAELGTEERKALPLAVLTPMLGTRAFNILSKMSGADVPYVGVLDSLDVAAFAAWPGSGKKCVEGLVEVCEFLGLGTIKLPARILMKRGRKPKPGEKAGRTREDLKAISMEAQARRFLEAFTPEEIQDLQLAELGDRLGVSRQRVQQILDGNPILKIMRGPDQEARRELHMAKAVRGILAGQSAEVVAQGIGVHPVTLAHWAARDPNFKRLIELGREVRKQKRTGT